MSFSRQILLLGSVLAIAAALGLLPRQAASQSLDPTLTDPLAIAQECGDDPNLGKPHFVSCAACHALDPAQATPRGPHLAELYGRVAGALPGYPYSTTLGASGVVWQGDTLHRLLSGEMGVPGHPVIADEQTRRDLLTWLRIETRPAPPAPDDVIVSASVLAIEGDLTWGEYLSGDCVSCHNATAEAAGMAPLDTLERDRFVTLMHRYRARAIGGEAMQFQAMRLSDEEIAALAEYFSSITRERDG